MTIEQHLGNRFVITDRLPAATASHQRYALQSASGTGGRFLLSYCDYARPVSQAALAQQRTVAEALSHPPVALLCRLVEHRLEEDYQLAISEFPGEMSLRELLQQRQSLSLEEAEAFLRLLTEACESATSLGWPLLRLDARHLYLDSRLGLPRIPTPDIPSFDPVGTDAAEIDPMQTMNFDAEALRQPADPIPKDTRDYVVHLAILGCDLLGQPQSLRGSNVRFKPVPQFSSHQNGLLRRALAGESRNAFPSAKAFMDEFFGISAPQDIATHTERLRILTAIAAHTNSHITDGAPVSGNSVTIKFTSRPGANVANAASIGPPSISEQENADDAPVCTHIRLLPNSEDAPVLVLVAEDWLKVGRSAGDADFVAQFRPRSNINDGRSRRISRIQSRLRREGESLVIEEPNPLNASVLLDQPLGERTVLPLPVTILLAGEYPLEIRQVDSDYPGAREIGGSSNGEQAPMGGAMVVRPNTAGILLWEASLIYSDVGLHFSASGKPWFRADFNILPAARFHRLKDQFWIEPLDIALVRRVADEGLPTAHELILLRDGAKFRAGSYTYTVQSYSLTGERSAERSTLSSAG